MIKKNDNPVINRHCDDIISVQIIYEIRKLDDALFRKAVRWVLWLLSYTI